MYRTEVEKLAAAEHLASLDAVVCRLPRDEADHRPGTECAGWGPLKVIEAFYAPIHKAVRALVKRAIQSSDIRRDFDPVDLLRALVGVAYMSASPDWQQSAKRLVDVLITGSRPII